MDDRRRHVHGQVLLPFLDQIITESKLHAGQRFLAYGHEVAHTKQYMSEKTGASLQVYEFSDEQFKGSGNLSEKITEAVRNADVIFASDWYFSGDHRSLIHETTEGMKAGAILFTMNPSGARRSSSKIIKSKSEAGSWSTKPFDYYKFQKEERG